MKQLLSNGWQKNRLELEEIEKENRAKSNQPWLAVIDDKLQVSIKDQALGIENTGNGTKGQATQR